ncbi:MAG: alkaline phosphatase family protein [Planctomycetes bacterium]|nr:alkaline phosphatase family protein [Planctomycetota bacterium]
MTRGLVVLDAVGLTPRLIGPETPHLQALAERGTMSPLECPFPALTMSAQTSILTGVTPQHHGIVGNGWWFRELAEPWLWRQPHDLIQHEDVLTRLRKERPGFTVAKLFWWFNMYAPVDWAVTPRPMYPADGRKVPDVHTQPGDLRDQLQSALGPFPLFRFWGPAADLSSTRWIADASMKVIAEQLPDLSLVYLPHLDYDFQRFGPDAPRSRAALSELDGIVGEFIALADRLDLGVLVLSEYGITEVSRPVHVNRVLRDLGMLSIRMEEGRERLDCGASRAFAIADHQIAHVYVRGAADRDAVRDALAETPGVERVLEGDDRAAEGLHHERAGDLVLVADADAWFTYYFWSDDAVAPDYARTVDIHRKPGYDPAELLLDPALPLPKLKIARRLLAKKLGFRNTLDVIGLDASVVKGSHGRRADDPADGPVLISSTPLTHGGEAPFPLSGMPDLLASLTARG